jgi:dolichol-phosphate mannosyltransferase
VSGERVLVVVPTYDEVENLEPILDRLRASLPDAHALVVDDGSPDGTGELAEKLAALDPRVHALRRTTKSGLGPAYVAGFRWGRERGYDVLVEMDADGSHHPEQLPDLLAALTDADLVLGCCSPGPATRGRAGRCACPWPTPPAASGRSAGSWSTGCPSTTWPVRATASRSTGRGGRSGPGHGWSRCPSRSPSARSAGAR